MLTTNQILHLLEAEQYHRLIRRILANGRCESAVAAAVLVRPEVCEAAARGLALQRLAELSYRVTPEASAVALSLVRIQNRGGHFGPAQAGGRRETSLAATAVAVRALLQYNAQRGAAAIPAGRIEAAIDRGLAALARAFRAVPPAFEADASGWAVVLWQLGGTPAFLQRVPVPRLRAALESSGTPPAHDDLARLALALAA